MLKTHGENPNWTRMLHGCSVSVWRLDPDPGISSKFRENIRSVHHSDQLKVSCLHRVWCFLVHRMSSSCVASRETERVWSLRERNPACLLYEKGSLADKHLRWCSSPGKPVQVWREGVHRISCPLPGRGGVLISVITWGHSLTFSPQVLLHKHFIPRGLPTGGLLARGHLETGISMFSAAPLTTARPWKSASCQSAQTDE